MHAARQQDLSQLLQCGELEDLYWRKLLGEAEILVIVLASLCSALLGKGPTQPSSEPAIADAGWAPISTDLGREQGALCWLRLAPSLRLSQLLLS